MEYVYAVLLLHKLGKEINEKNVKSVVAATGISINEAAETKIKSLIASLKDVDISKELESASLAVAAAPAVSAEAVKEEKPKEEKREAAAEGLSALFG